MVPDISNCIGSPEGYSDWMLQGPSAAILADPCRLGMFVWFFYTHNPIGAWKRLRGEIDLMAWRWCLDLEDASLSDPEGRAFINEVFYPNRDKIKIYINGEQCIFAGESRFPYWTDWYGVPDPTAPPEISYQGVSYAFHAAMYFDWQYDDEYPYPYWDVDFWFLDSAPPPYPCRIKIVFGETVLMDCEWQAVAAPYWVTEGTVYDGRVVSNRYQSPSTRTRLIDDASNPTIQDENKICDVLVVVTGFYYDYRQQWAGGYGGYWEEYLEVDIVLVHPKTHERHWNEFIETYISADCNIQFRVRNSESEDQAVCFDTSATQNYIWKRYDIGTSVSDPSLYYDDEFHPRVGFSPGDWDYYGRLSELMAYRCTTEPPLSPLPRLKLPARFQLVYEEGIYLPDEGLPPDVILDITLSRDGDDIVITPHKLEDGRGFDVMILDTVSNSGNMGILKIGS